MTSALKMPVLFVGHGSPMAAVEDTPITRAWRDLGRRLPRPRAILAISAHWETKGTLVTAAQAPRTIHDFYNFPPELYAIEYPAPGDPALAKRIEAMLPRARADLDGWGLDHGVWSVLRHAYPKADIPVLQLSMDVRLTPQGHYDLGRALRPLREQGVLILGAGNVVHNLRAYRPGATYPWAQRFSDAVKAKIAAGDAAALIDYPALDPDALLAAPEPDHYLPLLYVLGAAEAGERIEFLTDEVNSSLSMLSVLIGAEPVGVAA
jgi:4,5-DOPA dioxygenase extradiol